jgi:hypothetical protein
MRSPTFSAPVRLLGFIVAMLLAGLIAPPIAGAHGEGESDESLVLVRQAIALLVNKPGDLMAVQDKMNDCLEAPHKEGVNLTMVRQAMDMMPSEEMGSGMMMSSGDMMQVRTLLEQSIGARPIVGNEDPVQIGDVPPPLTGEDTGTLVVLDPLPGRYGLTGGAWLAIVAAGLVVIVGGALSLRLRPKLSKTSEGASR